MSTFIGDYSCKIDAKSRIVLPAAFKKQLSAAAQDRFVLKKDIFEACLVLYPMDEWEKQVEIIRKRINPYNKEHSKFFRGFFKGTAEVSLDANNRLLLPKRLLDMVGIDKDVILAGQDTKVEIWSKDNYETQSEDDQDFAKLAESIMGDKNEED